MELAVTCSCGSAYRSADVGDLGLLALLVFEHGAHTGFEEGPAAGVLLLLLAPDDLSVLILGQLGTEGVEWEGSKLLNSNNCNIIDLVCFSRGEEIIVNLTRTANNFLAVFWLDIKVLLG